MSNKKVSRIFYIISDMVDSVGLDQAISYLSSYPDVYDKNKLITSYIINSVCSESGLSKDQLMMKTGRNNIRVPALCCAVALLKNHTKSDNTEIGYILNKGRSRVSKYATMYNNLSDKIKSDREISELYDVINEKITKYKLTLK
tara:strand:- start:10041 stop:10472 length:432 start_codon:yes stop_codon:yes gene_type:complete